MFLNSLEKCLNYITKYDLILCKERIKCKKKIGTYEVDCHKKKSTSLIKPFD